MPNRYPGDVVSIVYAPSGAVTTNPSISIVQIANSQVIVGSGVMSLIPGTAIWIYKWSTSSMSNGDYVAMVSAVVGGVTINAQFLEIITLGDSRITGPVALDATCAKDATVAKAALTLQSANYVSPDASVTVHSILTQVNKLPNDPASFSSLISYFGANVQDTRDAMVGKWVIDNVANTLTMFRDNGSILRVFNLVNTPTTSSRNPS